MKRVILVLSCILLLFAGCSGEAENTATESTDTPVLVEDYVGEGTLTVLGYLVSSNANYVENVFIEGFLPVENGKEVKEGKAVYAPVKSETYGTYSSLKSSLEATYTSEAAAEILKEFDMYKDIEGVLHLNTKHGKTDCENYDWSNPQINVTAVSENSYEFNVTVLDESGKEHSLKAKAVKIDGELRLDGIIY